MGGTLCTFFLKTEKVQKPLCKRIEAVPNEEKDAYFLPIFLSHLQIYHQIVRFVRNDEEIFFVGLVNRKLTVFDALSMWQELFRRVEEGQRLSNSMELKGEMIFTTKNDEAMTFHRKK